MAENLPKAASPIKDIQSNFNGSNLFETIVRDMGSSSHWGLIMAPGLEANGHYLGKPFQSSTQKWHVECTHKNRLDEDSNEYTQHTISYSNKKISRLNFCILELSEEIRRDSKTISC